MQKLKLNLNFKKDRLYISKGLASNGHWLVKLDAVTHLKAFDEIKNLTDGRYEAMVKVTPDTPDMSNHFITKSDIHKRIAIEPVRGVVHEMSVDALKITGIVYKNTNDEEICVSPDYAPLMSLGSAWMSNKNSPIVITNDAGQTIAVIMPLRF